MEGYQKVIIHLLSKVANADDSGDALRWAQAAASLACNIETFKLVLVSKEVSDT